MHAALEKNLGFSFLAKVNMSSSVRLSVTFVHPTQAIKTFGNFSTPFHTLAI